MNYDMFTCATFRVARVRPRPRTYLLYYYLFSLLQSTAVFSKHVFTTSRDKGFISTAENNNNYYYYSWYNVHFSNIDYYCNFYEC